jgi:type I restriction enzyme S subunit
MSLPAYEKYKESGVSWVGAIPNHWKLLRTKTLFELKKRPPREEDGVVTAFRDGQVTLRSNRRTEGFTNSLQEIGYQGVRRGDLVIHAMDAFAGAIGVSDSDGKSTPVYSVCEPRRRLSNSEYYARLLRHMALSGFIESLAKGIRERSTEFRWAEAGNVYLPVPPIEEQTAIAAFLNHETAKIDALIAGQEKLIALLTEKRQATISRAVTKGLNPDAPMKDSAVAWLSAVPAHWEVKKLRYIANVVRGASPRPAGDPRFFASDNESGVNCPWVTVAEVTKDEDILLKEVAEYLTPTGVEQSQRFEAGTLIFTNSGATLGVPKVLAIDCCANDGILAFRGLSNKVNIRFLYYFLLTTTERLRTEMKQGGGQPNLNTGIVKEISLALPPNEEQLQVVNYLEAEILKLDILRGQAERAITLLKERRDALIVAAVTGQFDVRAVVPVVAVETREAIAA